MTLRSTIADQLKTLGDLVKSRKLTPQERAIAYSVFQNSIPYDRIFITTLDVGSAMTLVGPGEIGEPPIYAINWPDGYLTTLAPIDRPATLIHELTHVWQGHNGLVPPLYVVQSVWSQLSGIVGDVVKKRAWRGWGAARSTIYLFTRNDIGKDWSKFNVEQQASIVQSWFIPETARIVPVGNHRIRINDFGNGVYGGGASEADMRFPYIRDVIRARNRSARYRPLVPIGGSDPVTRSLQDKLVELVYLAARQADGTLGRKHSATLDAVAAFQRRNGLRVDRDLGGPNSATRGKLNQPATSLVRAQ